MAIDEANLSDFKIKLGTIIYKNTTIISKGHNYKEKSVRSITKNFIEWPFSIHAEVSAIINAKQDLKGCSIIVVRINNRNQLLLAKPCKYCRAYLEYVGIKKIWYSINEFPYIRKLGD